MRQSTETYSLGNNQVTMWNRRPNRYFHLLFLPLPSVLSYESKVIQRKTCYRAARWDINYV